MKKLLLIAALAGIVFTGCSKSKDVSGDGSEGNPFLISTAAQLKKLAEEVNRGDNKQGKHYKLTADISLSDYQSGEGWIPIGIYSHTAFHGHFDGGGHVISDLYINILTESTTHAGLFGHLEGGTIRNLGVKGNVLAPNNNCVGGIASRVSTPSKIEHCFFNGNVEGNYQVGGIAGAFAGSEISHCWTAGMVAGIGRVGGIAGNSFGGIKIAYCAALNQRIERHTGSETTFGRVVGHKAECELSNNMAWSGMEMPDGMTISSSHDNEHGLSRNSSQVKYAPTYVDHFPSPIWTRENNKLPGLGGRTEEIPGYIN